ncbi:uncharacterized protein LOC105700712 [Orussus abietinus]|uniref:uncharacterized protein LOC105700712 n=1 Tax=Orussus abietinus TaxID=222816 RepID=UPI000626B3D2|nr:uncharacterized protein LOC105700712 [Orussus abietinus]
MDHSPTSGALFILWCLLGSVWSGPTPTVPPASLKDSHYTPSRPLKSIVELVTPITKLPAITPNSDVRTTTVTSTTSERPIPALRPVYRLNGSNGQACILLQVDAIITVMYRTKLGIDEKVDIYVPDEATVTGNCDSENTVTMSLKWKAFVLSWSFSKTPGGERWYVDKIELTYNSSERHFEHIDQPNKTIRLSSEKKHSHMLFPTPVGKSYVCTDDVIIPLTDGKNEATVLLRDMKLQPFKFKNNEFAAEFSCRSLSARAGRDETAPVAVGSTLAAAVLLTIAGYAGWRYFKVNKVKYDTME